MFELIYGREAVDAFGDKRFSTELGMKHTNENYGMWRSLLGDIEVKKKKNWQVREFRHLCTNNKEKFSILWPDA